MNQAANTWLNITDNGNDATIWCYDMLLGTKPGFPHLVCSSPCDTVHLLLIIYMNNDHLLVLKSKLQEGGHIWFNAEATDKWAVFVKGSFKGSLLEGLSISHQHIDIPVSRKIILHLDQVRSYAQQEDFLHGWGIGRGGSHWSADDVTFDHQKASKSAWLSSQSSNCDYFLSQVRGIWTSHTSLQHQVGGLCVDGTSSARSKDMCSSCSRYLT